MKIEKVNWDSDFFGFNVGKTLIEESSLTSILEDFVNQPFELLYLFSNNSLKIKNDQNLKIKLVDIKTTFLKKIDKKIKPQPLINEYTDKKLTKELYSLAIQSGEYSRFNVDENISKDKYEKLYKLWVEKIIHREGNETIVVHKKNDIIKGFLALGNKEERADLTMGSVDNEMRGKGIGKQLFLEAERLAYKKGFKQIQIVTQGMNEPACNLYKKLGYNIDKVDFVYHIWKK